MVPGRTRPQTQETYHTEILQNFLMYAKPSQPAITLQTPKGARGDETADLIANLIGINALTFIEIENVIALIRAAFAAPETLMPINRAPFRSLRLLHQLTSFTDDASLQKKIAETAAYIQQSVLQP